MHLPLALFALTPGLVVRPLALRSSRALARMCAGADGLESTGDSLSSRFAAEVARRQREQKLNTQRVDSSLAAEQSFSGVREIVVREGMPQAISKRPPPTASTMEDITWDMLISPNFLMGCVLSLGSVILLVAIASADWGASV
ncbi:MAG: hypothetical protein SGPRY_006668 [Prymnesium sp.]